MIDVSNPRAPVELGAYDTPGEAVGVAVVEGYAYIADGAGGLVILRYGAPAQASALCLPLILRLP